MFIVLIACVFLCGFSACGCVCACVVSGQCARAEEA